MIVIADAGGSGTDWRIIDGQTIYQERTPGFNPTQESTENLQLQLSSYFIKYQQAKKVYYYGAGVLKQSQIINELQLFFKDAKIEVQSDLLAAARSTCGVTEGCVGIIGTGSNFGCYDGVELEQPVPSLGYLLGDEGSGIYMGKMLMKDYFRKKAPEDVRIILEKRFINKDVLSEIYSREGKAFLASLTHFLQQNIKHPYCYNLVYKSFQDYFDVFVNASEGKGTIHFIGSVAFYFNSILRQVAIKNESSVGIVQETPIAGLTLFHQNEEKL